MSLLLPADEEEEIRARYWHPGAEDVVVDVGSFVGTYTLPALAAGATVYAIDARAHTLQTLRELATANDLSERLTTVCLALYDGNAYPAELLDEISNSKYASSRDMIPDAPWATLDEVVRTQPLERVDWVKVDVEGGELGVLRGAKQTLAELRPKWLIEDHTRVYPWVERQGMARRLRSILEYHSYDVLLVKAPIADYIVASPQ